MTLGPAIISLGPRSAALALRLRAFLPGSEIHSPACADCAADARFAKAATYIAGLFAAGRPIVGLCASGILIRAVGPIRRQDHRAPGRRRRRGRLGRRAAPRRSSRRQRAGSKDRGRSGRGTRRDHGRRQPLRCALDAPPPGWTLANPGHAKGVMARLLEGSAVRLTVDSGDPAWLTGADLPVDAQASKRAAGDAPRRRGSPDRLVYHPPASLSVSARRPEHHPRRCPT